MVKCADCGFLASRNIQSRILEETEQETRNTGVVFEIHEAPICFVKAFNLWVESKSTLGTVSEDGMNRIRDVIQKERPCNQSQFVKWQQGSTPKEHQEMLDEQWMLDYQVKRDKEDKDWREKQEQLHNSQEWRRYIFLGIFTLIAAVIGGLVTWLVTKG